MSSKKETFRNIWKISYAFPKNSTLILWHGCWPRTKFLKKILYPLRPHDVCWFGLPSELSKPNRKTKKMYPDFPKKRFSTKNKKFLTLAQTLEKNLCSCLKKSKFLNEMVSMKSEEHCKVHTKTPVLESLFKAEHLDAYSYIK